MTSCAPIHSVFIVAACPFPAPQGSQVYVGQLANALSLKGLSVTLLSYPGAQPGRPLLSSTIQHKTTPRSFRPPRVKAGPSPQKIWLDWRLYRLLSNEVQRARPDIIHAQNIEAFLIAWPVCRRERIPLIYGVHGIMARELETYFTIGILKDIAHSVGSKLDAFAASRADGIHLLESACIEEWLATGARSKSTVVIPPGFDLQSFDAIEPAPIPSLSHEKGPLIVYGGNLDEYQDIDFALEAFVRVRQAIPHARLVLAYHRESGNYGRISRFCKSVAGASILKVNSFAEMKYLYERADMLLNTRSLRGGFPIKLLNYMAARKPIVTVQQSAPFLADQEQAIVVGERDAGMLATAILRLANYPALRDHLAANARETIEREFTWDRSADKIVEFYQSIYHENKHARGHVGAAH